MAKKFLTQIEVPELVTGNLSISPSGITSTQAGEDILITPTGIGALKIENRITLENILSFGPLDPQGSYMAVNAQYLQSGPLSAWQYLQNGTATKYEFANDGALTVFTAPAGIAGDLVLSWTQIFQIPNGGIIDAAYGGTGLTNANSTLAITGNASISGANTGDQIITLTGDVTGSGTGSFATTLANTTVTAGTYGNATQVAQYTVDPQGRLTSSTNVTITPAFSDITNKPTTLGGYGITDAQPLDSDLTAIAALTPTADNFIVGNGTSWVLETPAQAKTSIGLGNVDNLSVQSIFNSTGEVFNLRSQFDATTPSYGFGYRFVRGATNGPGTGSGVFNMFYSWYIGLGSPYPATGTGCYGAMFAVPRGAVSENKYYMSVRFNENNAFGSWKKIAAGFADSAETLSVGNAKLYTNTLPANNGASDTYIYLGRWTTTQTREKLNLSIVYQDETLLDTRRVCEYKFLFSTSNGVTFTAGSTGNFYAWGRGLILGEGGALSNSGTLAVQVSNTQYDFYVLALGNKNTGIGSYSVNTSGGTWVHSGTVFGTTAPTGNNFPLYLDGLLSNYSTPTFYSVSTLGQVAIDQAFSPNNNSGGLFLANSTGNRIDFYTSGSGLPTLTTRTVGTKIAFRQTLTGSTLDFAIGLSTDTMWYSVQNTSSYHNFYTGTNVACRIGDAGTSSRGVVYQGNSAITTLNATSTLTIAQILTLVIQSTPAANITFTLPTGTLTDAGVLASLETFRSFTWSVVNLAGFTITMAGGTGHTYVGNATIAANTSASFRTIKTAANTFTTYRI